MRKNLLLFIVAFLCATMSFAAQKKVAFVYQKGYNVSKYVWDANGYQPTLDPIYKGLAANFAVTDYAYAQDSVPDTTALKTYDLVVMSEAMSGGKTLSNTLVKLVGKVPMLNMKSFTYTSGRWGWATPANPTAKTTSVTINSGFENHAIFKDVTVTGGVVQIFDGTSTASNLIQGFGSIVSTSPIQSDKIIANVTGTDSYAIHEIDNLNFKYMMIPISSDVITTVSENGVKLVVNACNYLMGGNSGFDPDAPLKIAYLYDSSYSGYCGITKDPIYNNSVIAEKNCEAIDIKSFTATSTDTLAALGKYDLVVVSEAIGSGHTFVKPLLTMINRVPMLNLKSFFYKNTVWNWGAGVNPTTVKNNAEKGVTYIIVNKAYADHDLFANIEIADSTISLFKKDTYNGTCKNMVQGYTTLAGSLIESDKVLASVKGTTATYNAIHEHGLKNKYMLLPISSDAMMIADTINLSDNAIQMINNAVYYLAASKSSVSQAIKPVLTQSYGDGVTYVKITSATEGAKIYYTLDGKVPTTSSSLYSDTLKITTPCTVKAIATKQGFDNSSMDSCVVIIKSIVAMPSISAVASGKAKTVTITASDGSRIFYTVSGATPDTLKATLYASPFTLTRPCTVKAIAVQKDKLNSKVASFDITIDGYTKRAKTLVWANFLDKPSTWVWANTDTSTTDNGDFFGKTGYAYSDSLGTHTLKTVDLKNGFLVGSYGQRVNLQKTAVATSGNYSPETDGDAGATDRAMSFLRTSASSDPTTAYMVTTTSYAGPFDVTVWFTGAKGSTSYTEKLEVSVASSLDATKWTVLDTLSSLSDKFLRKRIAYYDATAPVYVKIASVSNLGTNSNMMIFDVKLMGEGEDPILSVNKPTVEKTIVSTRIYTLSGVEVKVPQYGLNIIRYIYSDGSVETKKIMIKERL